MDVHIDGCSYRPTRTHTRVFGGLNARETPKDGYILNKKFKRSQCHVQVMPSLDPTPAQYRGVAPHHSQVAN